MRDNQTSSSLEAQLIRMKLLLTTVLFLASITLSFGQGYHPSIHETQLNEYNASGNTDAAYYESIPTEKIGYPKVGCDLDKIVYGWHPYWVGTAYQNYQWDLLSHMSFFSYEVNAADGQPNSTHGWSTSAAIDSALASGNTKVTLCVTLFSGHTTFFSSPTAEQTLISNLINLVQSRGAHGVNIDFEGLPSAETTNFANFMVNLSNQMHSAISGSEVSTVLYAVDWNNVFDFSIMEPVVDHYIIMGYAYYYSGSTNAGPTDPLYHYGSSYNYTLSRSITYYLDKGCPKNKLVLGLPSYGYEWPTSGLTVPSSTTGSGYSRTYAQVRNNTSGDYSAANQSWEGDSHTDVYGFNSGGNHQCFMSMDSAWRKRLDHVRNTGIAGIGIWALGYDNGYTELWSAMEDYLTVCYEDPCSGEIHDFGGPTRDYYNDENYTWTIAPAAASSIDVQFTEFDVELNFDYLYIYDGADISAPQIAGSPFTGLTSPGSFTTSSGSVTFRFTSDGATVTPGFLATYSCNSIAPPTADFSVSATDICLGDSIALINNSIGADSYLWTTSTGGLSSTTAANPYLFPSSSGTYTVTLDATNVSGTTQVAQSISINVYQPAIAIASVNATDLYLPSATAFFTNSSVNEDFHSWDFGDGGTSTDTDPWHVYATAGIYSAYLVVGNAGCENDTLFFEITVHDAVGLNSINPELITVYPNPFSNELTIQTTNEIQKFMFFDSQGRSVPVTVVKSSEGYSVNIVDLAEGVYMLDIDIHGVEQRLKLVKRSN
ncbi:MAG: spore germination protein YaaH/PKD repeat protein [Flavobacteriaceae bacterium]